MLLAALELVPGEPSDLTDLIRRPSGLEALTGRGSYRTESSLTEYLSSSLDQLRIEYWHRCLTQLAENVRILIAGQEGYPRLLFSCWDAPPLLFVKGELPDRPGVAVVGSREADDVVLWATRDVAGRLADAGHPVISGLASGVDTAAHLGALEAGGQTVAVMGTGIERIFPPSNGDLADRIVESGALISQFAPPAPRTGTTFLRRNHVIAGLTRASVIMDGRTRSGSRHEIEQAAAYGRAVFYWAPRLGAQDWAVNAASNGLGRFFETPEELVALLGSSVKARTVA